MRLTDEQPAPAPERPGLPAVWDLVLADMAGRPAAPFCEHHAAVAAPTPARVMRTELFWPKEEEQRPVIRRNPLRGDWWILNRRRSGWGERGYYYGTLAELVACWACRIVGRAQDTHGEYLVIEEAPRDEAPQDVSAWEVTS